uniref:tRNA threonylcarbamoyladenosine biosynthesis protein TsaE n=1 Tax=candidate division WOR-3 bacterium TaxID=2052148 RepID=A0A7V3ZZC4_UNCW3
MTEFNIVTNSPEETREIGVKLAKVLMPPLDVLLIGELGAGKTELVRGFLSYFGHNVVRSPSFTVVNSFRTPYYTVHHIDLFRIKDFEEIEIRGILDLLSEVDSIRFIEWPEIIKDFLTPENSITFSINIIGEKQRHIRVNCMRFNICSKLFQNEIK